MWMDDGDDSTNGDDDQCRRQLSTIASKLPVGEKKICLQKYSLNNLCDKKQRTRTSFTDMYDCTFNAQCFILCTHCGQNISSMAHKFIKNSIFHFNIFRIWHFHLHHRRQFALRFYSALKLTTYVRYAIQISFSVNVIPVNFRRYLLRLQFSIPRNVDTNVTNDNGDSHLSSDIHIRIVQWIISSAYFSVTYTN